MFPGVAAGALAGAVACALLMVPPGAVRAAGQAVADDDDAFRLLLKVNDYVETFQKQFGSMVSEERYEQSIRATPLANARAQRNNVGEQTVLRSDFLLVQLPGEGWLAFRDVFERDGKPLRDREERLAKLFLGEAGSKSVLDKAKSIMDESARYNIGNVSRNINVPTLVLSLLTPARRTRVRFERRKADDIGTIVDFRETGTPTYVTTTGGRDLPVFGRFWVDPTDGTIRKTELHAIDPAVEAHITVTFEHDDTAGVAVPVRMEERYRRARDTTEVRGIATYSKFRRFQVSTSEALNP